MLPRNLHLIAQTKLAALNSAEALGDLRHPSLGLEKLSKDRAGQYSIRINKKYRICFDWIEKHAEKVEIVDYH